VLVQHGVDFRHFVKACDPATIVPEDLARLPKPVIGFFGLVAEWVDQEALAAIARANPNGSVVLIGKTMPDVDDSLLRSIPNIHFLGRKKYDELPGYCRGFDVALLPFKNNELTLNANPLKVREYLAAGLPVVATDLPEVTRLKQCRIAKKPADYVRHVAEALKDPGPKRERADRIFQDSWDSRVEEIRRHVGETMVKLGRGL
jgi:glycosyltransferase involved in cell wall biosynthesis